MSIPPDINMIFDIDDDKVKEDYMDTSDNDFDNMLDHILDATDGVSHTWKAVKDDMISEEISEMKRSKTCSFPIGEYIN